MKKIKYFSFALALFTISGNVFSQEKYSDTGEWINIDDNFINSVVTATDLHYNVTTGLLNGIKGDSIYLSAGSRVIPIDLNDLSTLSIEYEKKGSPGTVIGLLSAVYLGSLLFYTPESGSAKFLEFEEGFGFAAAEVLFFVAGGGIGYLIDLGSGNGKKVFYFKRDVEEAGNGIRDVKDFLQDHSDKRRLHFNVYASYVNTRLSEVNDRFGDYYPYKEITSLNLLRKLSLTYQVFDNVEFGIALNWFGEPNLNYYYYIYGYGTHEAIDQTFDGKGYYILVNYKPLKRIIPDNIDFLIGAGIGTGSVDYHLSSETITYDYPERISEISEHKINKSMFSAMFSAEIRLYIYPVVNLSLQADYIYLPEKMPAAPAVDLKEKDLGGFGFGLGFGLNF